MTPEAIDYNQSRKILTLSYSDGAKFELPAEYLRVESPSAEVQGHGPDDKKLIAGRRHVGIMNIEPVGHYAVRLVFDDMHDTGLYTWQTLHRLGQTYEATWAAYLQALERDGLSRDP